jgi:hypothetical protein
LNWGKIAAFSPELGKITYSKFIEKIQVLGLFIFVVPFSSTNLIFWCNLSR